MIGVNTAIFSPSGGSVGIAFAIPSDTVKSVVTQLKDHGSVTRGWIGVQIQPVTKDIADSLGLKKVTGALVAEPQADGPAKKAGIEAGDVITAVNGDEVKDARDLAKKIGALQPKAAVKLTVLHKGAEKTVSLTLGELPNSRKPAPTPTTTVTTTVPTSASSGSLWLRRARRGCGFRRCRGNRGRSIRRRRRAGLRHRRCDPSRSRARRSRRRARCAPRSPAPGPAASAPSCCASRRVTTPASSRCRSATAETDRIGDVPPATVAPASGTTSSGRASARPELLPPAGAACARWRSELHLGNRRPRQGGVVEGWRASPATPRVQLARMVSPPAKAKFEGDGKARRRSGRHGLAQADKSPPNRPELV